MRDREPWNLDDESGWQAEEVVAPRRPTSRRLMEWGVIAALAAGVIVLARNSEAPQQQRPTQEATPVATPSLEAERQARADRLVHVVIRLAGENLAFGP